MIPCNGSVRYKGSDLKFLRPCSTDFTLNLKDFRDLTSDFKVFRPDFRDLWSNFTNNRDCRDSRDLTSDFRTFVLHISEVVGPSSLVPTKAKRTHMNRKMHNKKSISSRRGRMHQRPLRSSRPIHRHLKRHQSEFEKDFLWICIGFSWWYHLQILVYVALILYAMHAFRLWYASLHPVLFRCIKGTVTTVITKTVAKAGAVGEHS